MMKNTTQTIEVQLTTEELEILVDLTEDEEQFEPYRPNPVNTLWQKLRRALDDIAIE